jgi:hypothetical protein
VITTLPLRAVVPALFAVALLGGCNSGSDSSTAGPAAGNAPGNAIPGASGLLAAIDGTTLQVQNDSTQTTVTYGASTTFTDSVAATAADVKVGMCVTARPPTTSGTPAAGGATDAVTAVSVQLVAPVNGSCTGGAFGAPAGARPSGSPRVRPSGTPRPDGSGRPGGTRIGATGKIASVTGSSFVVERTMPPGGDTSATPPTPITVTTTSTTTYAKTVAAKATALVTGKCVTAIGKADDAGAIAATSISVRAAENGTCTAEFGRRPGANGGTNG